MHTRRTFIRRGAIGAGALAIATGPRVALGAGGGGYGPLVPDPGGLLDLPEGLPLPGAADLRRPALRRQAGPGPLRRHGRVPGPRRLDVPRAQPRAAPGRRRDEDPRGRLQPVPRRRRRRHHRAARRPRRPAEALVRDLLGHADQLRRRRDAMGHVDHVRGGPHDRARLLLRGRPRRPRGRALAHADPRHGLLLARGLRRRPEHRHRLPDRGRRAPADPPGSVDGDARRTRARASSTATCPRIRGRAQARSSRAASCRRWRSTSARPTTSTSAGRATATPWSGRTSAPSRRTRTRWPRAARASTGSRARSSPAARSGSTTPPAARRGSGQIFRYLPRSNRLELFLEGSSPAQMESPDNMTITPWGDLWFVEDGARLAARDGRDAGRRDVRVRREPARRRRGGRRDRARRADVRARRQDVLREPLRPGPHARDHRPVPAAAAATAGAGWRPPGPGTRTRRGSRASSPSTRPRTAARRGRRRPSRRSGASVA